MAVLYQEEVAMGALLQVRLGVGQHQKAVMVQPAMSVDGEKSNHQGLGCLLLCWQSALPRGPREAVSVPPRCAAE